METTKCILVRYYEHMSTIDGDSQGRSTKERRLEHPSGWLYLTQHESVPILIDALLDWPPHREFNQSEFAEHAGVTRQTVASYLPILCEVSVVEPVPNTTPTRYRLADSDVVRELHELNSALNAAASSENQVA